MGAPLVDHTLAKVPGRAHLGYSFTTCVPATIATLCKKNSLREIQHSLTAPKQLLDSPRPHCQPIKEKCPSNMQARQNHGRWQAPERLSECSTVAHKLVFPCHVMQGTTRQNTVPPAPIQCAIHSAPVQSSAATLPRSCGASRPARASHGLPAPSSPAQLTRGSPQPHRCLSQASDIDSPNALPSPSLTQSFLVPGPAAHTMHSQHFSANTSQRALARSSLVCEMLCMMVFDLLADRGARLRWGQGCGRSEQRSGERGQ